MASSSGKVQVVFRDREAFEAKKRKFLEGGKEMLQVITDFDMTLTRFWINGTRGLSSHGAIERGTALGPEFSAKTRALFEKYYPIEISPGVPPAEKEKAMIEWWSQAHDLMMQYGLRRDHLKDMVATANIEIRDTCRELLEFLDQQDVPVLIFSAGIANVLKEFLHFKKVYHKNIHVISNLMSFDEHGNLMGFEGNLIHSMNKKAEVIKNLPSSWAHDERRKHILLMGDNLMDIHMSEGLVYSELISVGFLNDRIEERLEVFKETFDVVITHDGPMDFPLALVREIVGA